MPGTVILSQDDVPKKIGDGLERNQKLEKKQECAGLYAGSKFAGEQKSGRSSYEVTVELQFVDLRTSFLCGYLNIKGLTEDWPDLCTFFEAEIVGPHNGFQTRKWGANEKTDLEHWSQFPMFDQYAETFCDDEFTYDYESSDVIFMRWKEHFLVPDHRIKSISGASFAGFYYIAYQKSTDMIMGFYFHENSEKFQHLSLKHTNDRKHGSAAFQFR
ncbi:vacuolar import and degradation protein-domain-containing protein [Chytridium lagenaria]|nr:vacuolar import and degradation protein-domain-containing protein [Chytridium lagenaria]